MGVRRGLTIAVDKTLRGQVGVRFAESSAEKLAKAWGIKAEHLVTLAGPYATKAVVDATLADLKRTLKKDDELFVFVSTPTINNEETTVIALWDSWPEHLEGTSFALEDLIETIANTKAKQAIVWLEVPETSEDVAAIAETMLPSCALFVSSQMDETPHVLPDDNGSAWVKVMAQGLVGQLPMGKGDLITVAALQKAVGIELPRLLRKEGEVGAVQHPQLFAKNPALVVTTVKPFAADSMGGAAFARVFFRQQEPIRVRELPGFRKNFRLPDRVDPSSLRFVRNMAEPLLREELTDRAASIRQAFGYSRKDVSVVHDRESGGTVRTPGFVYRTRTDLNTEDPTLAIIVREAGLVTDRSLVHSAAWADCFGNLFDEIIFEYDRPMAIENTIDTLEASNIKGMKVTEIDGGQACQVKLAGFAGSITFSRTGIIIAGKSDTAMGLLDILVRLLSQMPQTLALEGK